MPTLRPTKTAKTNRAFTLVEMLVVIAISAVLFTLLLGPLINAFRLTQSAQMQTAAQDAARRTSEIISRELGTAAYVFSNTTHPFAVTASSTDPAVPDVRYSNFLVLNLPKENLTTGALIPTGTPGVAFDAKLDFVLPRHNTAGQLIDPTTNDPITITKSGAAAPTGLTFPAAPGTTMIRYFLGLRQPFVTKAGALTANPYATQGEGASLANNGNNTYVLYRAQFTPSTAVDPNTGKQVINGDNTTVDEKLFTPKLDATGNPTNTPELDDPDFFRIVTTADPNWLDAAHANYSAADANAHNMRVQNWFQIAKPVIGSPNIDLILLPHGPDSKLAFDDTTGRFPGVAHSGAVHDPVTGTDWPVVNPSVTFRFASVTADATASTTTDYGSQGVGANAAASNGGLPYVPTVYTATDQSWASPYRVGLYRTNPSGPAYASYDTAVAATTSGAMTAGDLIESMYTSPTDTVGLPVYDISTGMPLITSGANVGLYVPMTVAPDTGTINFNLPALPEPPTTNSAGNSYHRYFYVPVVSLAAGTGTNGYLDLSAISNSSTSSTASNLTSPLPMVPLDPSVTPTPLTQYQVANARIVPGSVRVYGPDAYPGPNQAAGAPVLYSEVLPGDAVGPRDNQYEVDYAHNALRMYVSDLQSQSGAIQVAFDYQANLAPAVPASGGSEAPIGTGNPAYPLGVKVDYQTRDLLDVNVGVRVYDPNNAGPAQVVTVHNQVRIGNSNR